MIELQEGAFQEANGVHDQGERYVVAVRRGIRHAEKKAGSHRC